MNDKTWQKISNIPEPLSTWTDSMDIRDFIRTLPDPEQSMCWMLVVDGVSQARVARRFKMTPGALTEMVRSALEPLRQAFDIPEQVSGDRCPTTSARGGGYPRGVLGGARVLPKGVSASMSREGVGK